MLSMLSDKLRVSYPIFLVVTGLLISLFPGVPRILVDPDIIFVIFLPPLLYSAAWNTAWKEFWHNRRPIGLLAFGLVICTACAVAWVSNRMIPGFSPALGFLLGGIVSPPDAVAAAEIHDRTVVCGIEIVQFGMLGDAGIARGRIEFRQERRLRQLPGQSMLASTRPNH